MTEQVVEGVVSAEVDAESHKIMPKGTLGAETAVDPSEPVNVNWTASGQGHLIGERPKTLTERFNEAYDEEAKREDEEFVRNLKRYHRRRFSDEW
jgi:hypothetical protein